MDTMKRAALNRDKDKGYQLGCIYLYGLFDIDRNVDEALRWFMEASDSGSSKARQAIKGLANQGDPRGCYYMGLLYYYGSGYKTDDKKAFEWFQKGTDKGDLDSLCRLGMCYVEGASIERDADKGISMIRESAEKGSLVGARILAESYLKGIGVERSRTYAMDWYQKGVEQNDPLAICALGEAYLKGDIFKDEDYAFKLFKKGAGLKDRECMFYLAYSYATGKGTEINLEESTRWLIESANLGYAPAAMKLAHSYFSKDIVREENPEESFKWLKKACDLGDERAYFQLAHYYEEGYGCKKNEKKAFNMYLKAYRKDFTDKDAVTNLARCYSEGIGTKKDETKVLALYREAYEKGDQSAIYGMANCYEKGIGTEVNLEEALHCYEEAYKNNPDDFLALDRLCKCFKEGKGVEQNEEKYLEYRAILDETISKMREEVGDEFVNMILKITGIDDNGNR